MAKATADEIITQGHKRLYVQFGGARPSNSVRYGGVDGQRMMVSGVSKSYGDITTIWAPDPHRPKKFQRIGRSVGTPDDPTATLTFLEQHGSIPAVFRDSACQVNIYEVSGRCKDLSDFSGGWEDYVLIYAGGEPTSLDGGDRTAWDGDDQVEDAQDFTFADIYPIGAVLFGAQASSEVSREIADITYGGGQECGNCGPANDGTQWIYAVAKSSGSGSPGLPGELIYSTDGGLTWTETAITGIGASEDPKAVKVVNDKLVILTGTAGGATTSGYYWATIAASGTPGAFTKVTSGFVAGAVANDMFVLNPREIFFVANSGYIYKSTDITSGVSTLNAGAATSQNLLRIHGYSDTLYAVGANSTVLKSGNRGTTWAATVGTIPTTVASIQAIAVLDQWRAWAGSSSGRVFSTLDAGETWDELTLSDADAIHDIVFPTDEVGYISYATSAPAAKILTTWNGGADWTLNGTGPRLQNLPTMDRVNRVAAPIGTDSLTAANYVALAALHGDGLDGLIALGSATTR